MSPLGQLGVLPRVGLYFLNPFADNFIRSFSIDFILLCYENFLLAQVFLRLEREDAGGLQEVLTAVLSSQVCLTADVGLPLKRARH